MVRLPVPNPGEREDLTGNASGRLAFPCPPGVPARSPGFERIVPVTTRRAVACGAGLSPFLRFELLEECSEMRGDGSRQGVVVGQRG